MRLWHESLIARLPRQQLLGQHRECAALRGGGWGKKHATVDYVFCYSPYKLFQYHCLVMAEMKRRGYQPAKEWWEPTYRGKVVLRFERLDELALTTPVYPEHDSAYLRECLANLNQKNVILIH